MNPEPRFGWWVGFCEQEHLIGLEHADEPQAERGLKSLRTQFGGKR